MGKGTWESYFDEMKKQNWEGAKQSLLALAQTEKKNPQVYIKTGDIHQRLGMTADAVDAYHHAAALLRADGFLQKAAAIYKIILRLVPDNAKANELSRQLLDELDSAKSAKPRFVETPKAEAPEVIPMPEPAPVAPEEQVSVPVEAGDGISIPEFFSGISEKDAKEFLGGLRVQSFDDGQMVVEEGDSGDSMYLVRSGNARVIAHLLGREIELGRLSANDLFGEVSFLSGRPRTASVIAEGPLEVYEIGRLDLESLIALDPTILSSLEEFRQCRARDTISRVREAGS